MTTDTIINNVPRGALIDARQLAGWLIVPDAMLVEWRDRGEGPPWIKVGDLVRYEVAAVRRWLRGQAQITSRSAPALLRGLLRGLRERFADHPFYVTDVVGTTHEALRAAVDAHAGDINAQQLGCYFRGYRGLVVDGLQLTYVTRTKRGVQWRVVG